MTTVYWGDKLVGQVSEAGIIYSPNSVQIGKVDWDGTVYRITNISFDYTRTPPNFLREGSVGVDGSLYALYMTHDQDVGRIDWDGTVYWTADGSLQALGSVSDTTNMYYSGGAALLTIIIPVINNRAKLARFLPNDYDEAADYADYEAYRNNPDLLDPLNRRKMPFEEWRKMGRPKSKWG
jgi:hypothetical protein